MTVKQLKEFLSQFPDSSLIFESRYSDSRLMDSEYWTWAYIIYKPSGDWHRILSEREYNKLTEEAKGTVVKAPFFRGN